MELYGFVALDTEVVGIITFQTQLALNFSILVLKN